MGFTKERLLKIQSWSETYGPGSNVVLPAEDAEELARIALASMTAEPVAWRWNYGGSTNFRFQDSEPRAGDNQKCLRVIQALYTAPPAPVSVPEEVISTIESLKQTLVDCNRYNYCFDAVKRVEDACRAAMLHGKAEPVTERPELTVWYGSMPESNGKTNWTAILHRKGEGRCFDGFTIDRSEYPGRVLYAADRVRYLIGEKEERPSITDYDADAHSGYAEPISQHDELPHDPQIAAYEKIMDQEQKPDYSPSLTAMMHALDAFYADDDVPERAMLTAFKILLADVSSQVAPQQEAK